MTRRVLVWDPLQTGHHPIWLTMLSETAPPGVEVIFPDWFDDTRSEARTFRVLPADALVSITHALEQVDADVLLLPDLRPLLRSAARWRRIEIPAIVAVDHGSEHVRLLEEPVRSLGLRRSASAVRHLVWREVLVRRQPIMILTTNPDSPRLGSSRLRAATRHLSMPIEELREIKASRWPSTRQRLVLVGALQPRKGLEPLVKALELLDSEIDKDALEILVAGRPSTAYRPEVRRLLAGLTDRGFRARFVDRYLGDDEYSAVVSSADVVVLPYDRFVGGSGIVGALMGIGPSVVISDYGWLGRFAAEQGAYTYPNGDTTALSHAILGALRERRPLRVGGTGFLPKERALKGLWDAVLS